LIKNYYQKDEPFRINYRATDFVTGLTDVRITIRKSNGVVVVNDVQMTELGEGIYFYNFTPTEATLYVAEVNSASNPGPDNKSFLVHEQLTNLAWSSQSYRVFYTAANQLSGLTDVKIIAWNESTKIVDEEVMTESATPGVYYYDVTMPNAGNYVFKVDSATNPSPDMKSVYVNELDLTKQYIFTNITGTARDSINIRGAVD